MSSGRRGGTGTKAGAASVVLATPGSG
jgi:hypothetical protein